MSEPAPRKPWTRLEKWLLGGSAAAVVAIGLVAWSRMDDGPDLPDCPSVKRATRRLEDARRQHDLAGSRDATASLAAGWLCRHPTGDAAALRDFLAKFDPPPPILEGSVMAIGRLVDHADFPPRPVPPPEQRPGRAGARAIRYLREAFGAYSPALPPQDSATLQVDPERILVVAASSNAGEADLVLFERTAGAWRRAGTVPSGGSGGLQFAWIDPDLHLVVLSADWKSPPRSRIVDLAAGMPTLAELPGKNVIYAADRDELVVFESWAPPAPVNEGGLRYTMELSRSDAGVRIDLALRNLGKKGLFEALDGGPEARAAAAASPEIADFLGKIARRDVHRESPPDTIDVSCDKLCPKGPCRLTYGFIDHAFRVTAVTGPTGCDPLHPAAR